jgi:hypothetical protein
MNIVVTYIRWYADGEGIVSGWSPTKSGWLATLS